MRGVTRVQHSYQGLDAVLDAWRPTPQPPDGTSQVLGAAMTTARAERARTGSTGARATTYASVVSACGRVSHISFRANRRTVIGMTRMETRAREHQR